MDPPAEICENYQLKWSSYTSYIHACIANSLVAEDSFADVALVTMDGHKIMAHRFVLAYSSQYLCKALKFQPKVTTALPIMVVLPQGITYKALKILVKYMYSGEATVSKDILNTVLKAGDILKVKGLYREAEPPAKAAEPAKEAPKNPPALVAAPKARPSEPAKAPAPGGAAVKKYGGPRVLNFSMSNFNGLEKEKAAAPKRPNQISQIILNQKLAPKEKPHTITSAEAEAAAPPPKDSMFLLIKDEPVEWVDADMEIVDEKVGAEEEAEPVKAEYDSASNEGSSHTTETYTPLTCELCTETFTIPGDWVKHVQTHTDMLPAKRRRRDSPDEEDENASYPELQCDLCDKAFSTPAAWVRHIQSSHTDLELSLSNEKNHQPPHKANVKKYKFVMKK